MAGAPNKRWLPLIAAKIVCCGGLVLVLLAGGFGSLGAWFSWGALGWLLVAAALAAAAAYIWRRRAPARSGRTRGAGGEPLPEPPDARERRATTRG